MLYLSSLLLRLMSQFFDLANSEHVATTAMLRRSRHNLLSLINLPNTTKCLVFFQHVVAYLGQMIFCTNDFK